MWIEKEFIYYSLQFLKGLMKSNMNQHDVEYVSPFFTLLWDMIDLKYLEIEDCPNSVEEATNVTCNIKHV